MSQEMQSLLLIDPAQTAPCSKHATGPASNGDKSQDVLDLSSDTDTEIGEDDAGNFTVQGLRTLRYVGWPSFLRR